MSLSKHILLSLSIVLVIVLAIGCGNKINININSQQESIEETNISAETPIEGGEVLLPLTNFNTLNPLLTDNYYYYQFSKLIFESLFDFNENLEPVPILVDEYNIYNEGKSIHIKIKDNIKWHDGAELTCEDISFTLDVIKYIGSEGTYGKAFDSLLNPMESININKAIETNVIDDKNMEIHFDKKYSNNLEALTFPIIPKHVFYEGSITNSYINASKYENYIPIGTGPYKFANYEKFKTVTLERNINYWDGIPYIEKVIGRVLEDEKLILTAFETGQISFASTIGVDWDKYRQNNRIKVLEYISPNYEFLGFNFNNELFSGDKGQAIRKAINYGIDRQAIIQKASLGHGTQVDVPIHPNSYLISPEANIYGYNVDMAKEILKEAGFTDMNDDGILEDEEGNKLSFGIITNSYNVYRFKVAELVAEYLKKLGIEINLEFESDFRENIGEDMILKQWNDINLKLEKGDFDIVLLGWQTSVTPELFSMFHSSKIIDGKNFIKYSNENMDNLILETIYSSNIEEKMQHYKNLQEFIVDDLPYVSLFFKNRGLLVDTKVLGPLEPSFFKLYKGLEKCFIPEELQ